MYTTLFSHLSDSPRHKEGDLYKRVNIKGKIFDLYYGYYEEIDRRYNDPDVIYPNFIEKPQYIDCGKPIVTLMQDACAHFDGKKEQDNDCSQCKHFERCEDFFGICNCIERLKRTCD